MHIYAPINYYILKWSRFRKAWTYLRPDERAGKR
jgi:hypothetical protein